MADLRIRYLFLSILFFAFNSGNGAAAATRSLNVVSFGAKGDGRTDSSYAFLAAWSEACASATASSIYVPTGRFYVRTAAFNGPCKNNAITFQIDGTLVAPSDYRVIGDSEYWIIFRLVDGLTISGGVLDGQGTALWACKTSCKSCPMGASSLELSNSKNIVISSLSLVNSQMFHIVVNGCQDVKMQGLRISASGRSPNTDGIHVQLSSGVTIVNTKIGTGDDCISIGPGTSNLWIENVVCGPGHGISIGSLGKDLVEAGVQNVTVKLTTFIGTQNGLRIKTWGRASCGFARNIVFQQALMTNVQNPIVIDQNYCPSNKGCPGQESGVKISGVTYQDIYGTSATEVAVNFDCSSKNPCTGIRLQNVKLTYNEEVPVSSCSNAWGTVSGIVQPASCL